VNPAKLRAAETDALCLKCHLNQPTHVGRINSSHAKSQVSCVACHSIHKNGPNGLVARRQMDINRQCAACHTDVWASFQQPHKHRLPEGAMSCVDCHNPHGSGIMPASLQTFRGNEPGCLKCHGNLAGPFTYEHAPVRLEGCMTCHLPHGSPNPRLLTRQETRFVCLECHSNLPVPSTSQASAIGSVPPAFHDIRSPRFRNCMACHQKIHGSYVDRGLLR
jgi:DmsE family decaheme c-type cytochrome